MFAMGPELSDAAAGDCHCRTAVLQTASRTSAVPMNAIPPLPLSGEWMEVAEPGGSDGQDG
jgi:hypothetical protein